MPSNKQSAFPLPIRKYEFDTTPNDFYDTDSEGMSLRDYFAAKAIQGIMSNPYALNADGNVRVNGNPTPPVTFAFLIADAMLAERNKTT